MTAGADEWEERWEEGAGGGVLVADLLAADGPDLPPPGPWLGSAWHGFQRLVSLAVGRAILIEYMEQEHTVEVMVALAGEEWLRSVTNVSDDSGHLRYGIRCEPTPCEVLHG